MKISSDESAARTYLRAAIFLAPAFLAWAFACVLLAPTLETILAKVGVTGLRAHWFIDSFNFFVTQGCLVIPGVILLFVALEYSLPGWPRHRRFAVALITFILNAAVLIGLATFCTSAMVAAKALMKSS